MELAEFKKIIKKFNKLKFKTNVSNIGIVKYFKDKGLECCEYVGCLGKLNDSVNGLDLFLRKIWKFTDISSNEFYCISESKQKFEYRTDYDDKILTSTRVLTVVKKIPKTIDVFKLIEEKENE